MIRWLILVLVLVIVLSVSFGGRDPFVVEVEPVQLGDVEKMITNSRAGDVRTRHQALISPESPGRILKIMAREGAQVVSGDVLFCLDDREWSLSHQESVSGLALARAHLLQATAILERAAGDLTRAARLKRGDQISREEYDRIRLEHEGLKAARQAAEAGVREAQDRVDRARYNLERCVVRAPFSGSISQRWHEEGEWAVPGDPVLELVSVDDLYVTVDIDETDMGELRPGYRARVYCDPWKGVAFTGEVIRVSSKLRMEERQNRTLETEIRLDPWDRESYNLLPGISADAEILLKTHADVVRIPAHAVLEGQRAWFLVGGEVVERTLTLGLRNWEWVEVLSGADVGDLVITSLGQDDLSPGVQAVAKE